MRCCEYCKAHQQQTMLPSAPHKPSKIYEQLFKVKSGFSSVYLSQVNNMHYSGDAYQASITISPSLPLTVTCKEKLALGIVITVVLNNGQKMLPSSKCLACLLVNRQTEQSRNFCCSPG